jgi:PAS domain S-box-containing protein
VSTSRRSTGWVGALIAVVVQIPFVGAVVVYLSWLVKRKRRGLEEAYQKLRTAHDALADSAEPTRELIELAPDGFLLADFDGRFVDVNRAACGMLGYAQEELIGRRFVDLISAAERPRLRSARDLVREPGQVHRADWALKRKDGGFLPAEVNASTLPDGRWIAFVRDISERKRMEQELRASESKFRTLAEAMPQIVWITGPGGLNKYFNQQWVQYTGLTLEQSYGHGWNTPFHPDDRQRAWDAWQHAVQTDGVYSLECRLRRADGTYRWWLIRGASLHDENGKVIDWFGTCTDIDNLKKTEAALERAREEAEAVTAQLRESEERFRLTIDEAPIGMALVALDGRFVRVNRALCEIVGYDASELTQLTFQAITHPDELNTDLALAEQLARGQIPRYQLAKRYIRKDGTTVDIMLNASILRSPSGAPLFYIAQIEDITLRKRAEEAVRNSEAKFSGIVSISADAIIAIDDAQRITIFNAGAEKIFGYTEAEIVDAPLETLIPERFRSIHHQHVDRFAVGQDVARRMGERGSAIVGRRKNGEEFPADAAISKLDIGGKRILTVALRDVTEQQRAQHELRQSQERFELALQGADLASWDWNIKTGEVIFNSRWAEMRGFRPNEIKPHVDSWISGIHPDDRPRVERALSEHFQGRSAEYETELRVGTKSGRWLWILDRGKVFARDAAGNPTRMVGTELDITERKRFEMEQQFLAEAAGLLAGSLDYEQTLTTVAQLAVRDFADWCIVEVLEEHNHLRRLKVAAADPARASVATQLERLAIDRARPYITRSIVEHKQSLVIEQLTAQDIESFAQGPEHLAVLRALDARSLIGLPLVIHGQFLGTLSFISSTRLYGQGDLRLAEALSDRAAVAIDNARFYRAAVEATQLRDQVLGVVAHDLRNPLGAILLQASALQRKGPEPERRSRKPTESIQRSATRMSRLIQDLLDVAQMEAGKLTIAPEPLSAGALVVEAVDAQNALASSSSLELRLEVERDAPAILADRDRLTQVFDNLIGNAIKFTKAGGRVTVGAVTRPREVVFSVADTGPGIAPEVLPRVFDRFWQATRSDRRGAGLGLPICKGIVEAHGGRIWVESTLGAGSTFFFTIPQALPAEPRPQHVMH